MKTPSTMVAEMYKAAEFIGGMQDALEQCGIDYGLILYPERAKMDDLWRSLVSLKNDLLDAAYEAEEANQ